MDRTIQTGKGSPMLKTLGRDDLLLTCAALLLALAIPLGVVSCDKVPLLAPTGTVITLLTTSNTVSLNSTVDLIATAIENGQAAGTGTGTGTGSVSTGTSGAGTPVQNGTLITFTTTIGHVEPAEARTHNGQVTVKLITTGQSGTATITAYSGGASTSLQLKIGTAAEAEERPRRREPRAGQRVTADDRLDRRHVDDFRARHRRRRLGHRRDP